MSKDKKAEQQQHHHLLKQPAWQMKNTSTPCPRATKLVAARARISKQADPRHHQVVHLQTNAKIKHDNMIVVELVKKVFLISKY